MQTKEEIAREVQDELSKAFAAFGYEILQALVTDIDPDPKVKSAMNEVSGCLGCDSMPDSTAATTCSPALRLRLFCRERTLATGLFAWHDLTHLCLLLAACAALSADQRRAAPQVGWLLSCSGNSSR